METTPHFLNGVHSFSGSGLETATPLAGLRYAVPSAKRAQLIYFRGGNSSAEMVAVQPGARRQADAHLPDRRQGRGPRAAGGGRGPAPGQRGRGVRGGPGGLSGQIVLDIGFLEI